MSKVGKRLPFFRNKIHIQHDFIKDSGINVEIGGNRSGGSFKLSYQIANVTYPNSWNITIVFSIFEA